MAEQKSDNSCSETIWALKSVGSNITHDEPK